MRESLASLEYTQFIQTFITVSLLDEGEIVTLLCVYAG
jgi:hypothetical protein